MRFIEMNNSGWNAHVFSGPLSADVNVSVVMDKSGYRFLFVINKANLDDLSWLALLSYLGSIMIF